MINIDYEKLFKVNVFFLATYCFYALFSILLSFPLGVYAVIPNGIIFLSVIPVIYTQTTGHKIREIFSLRMPSFKNVLLVVLGSICVLVVAQFIANIAVKIYELFGKIPKPQINLETKPALIALQVFMAGLLIPVLEETFFRGYVLGMFRRVKLKHYVILSGVLFGLFHLQIHVVFGTIFAGIVWGYFVKYSGSLVSGMIGHILFNSITVALMHYKARLKSVMNGDTVKSMQTQGLVIYFGVVVLAGLIIYFVLKTMKKDYDKLDETHEIKTWQADAIEKREAEKEDKAKTLYELSLADKYRAWSPTGIFVVLVIIGSVLIFMK